MALPALLNFAKPLLGRLLGQRGEKQSQEANWETEQAKASAGSWKDEALLIWTLTTAWGIMIWEVVVDASTPAEALNAVMDGPLGSLIWLGAFASYGFRQLPKALGRR